MIITDLLEAVVAKISEIEGVESCLEYPRELKTVSAPAVLIELVEAVGRRDAQALSDELPLTAELCATICISTTYEDAERQARALAIEVALVIHKARGFGIDGVEAAGIRAIRNASIDLFGKDAASAGFVSWQVEASCGLTVSDTVWSPGEVQPIEIFVGWDGGEHEPLSDAG